MVIRILPLACVILVSGCATLPPAKSISDIGNIVGKWEGTYDSAQGRLPLTMSFKTDGTYEAVLQRTIRSEGAIYVSGGKAHFRSATTSRTGTLTLHEGNGKRLLKGSTDDAIDFELTPAK
jgi:hypothetical protein